MASRLLGFVRDILIASLLGAGPVADSFFVALRLPNLFRRLFGEGAFNAAFVPSFTGLLATEGPASARRFAQEAMGVMAFWLLVLTILGEIFMPQLMTVIAPGFRANPQKFALAVELARITFPYLLLICLSALVSGVLNGLERFAAAAAAQILFNVISIAALFLLTPFLPTAGHALSWGVTISGVAQLALVLWASARAGMPLRLPRPRMTPAMRQLLRRMAPGLLGASVFQLNLAIDTIIGSLLPPGSVSLLYYADRVNQLPLGTIGSAVGTALLPLLSRQVRAGEDQAASDTMNRALEYALLLTLPAALALIVAALPIISVLFGRGAFDHASAVGSAEALAAYALGLPAVILVKVLAPGFFARDDMATPVKVSIACVAINLVFNLALMGPLQQVGPALSTSLAGMFNCACLGLVLRRRGHLRLDARLRSRLPRIALAAVAMGVVLFAAERLLTPALTMHGVVRWLALAALIAAGMATYAAAAQLFGAFDLREMASTFLRRRRPRSPARPAVAED